MAEDLDKWVASEIAESVVGAVGDRVFKAKDRDPESVPFWEDGSFSGKLLLACVGLLGGAPIALALKAANWCNAAPSPPAPDPKRERQRMANLIAKADSGNALACESLAYCYLLGNGVPKDEQLGRAYLERGAKLGNRRCWLLLDTQRMLAQSPGGTTPKAKVAQPD